MSTLQKPATDEEDDASVILLICRWFQELVSREKNMTNSKR
ncbi:MAG: hypothetical protein AAFR31_21020 [Cyanobacteria bacterium J06627_8]